MVLSDENTFFLCRQDDLAPGQMRRIDRAEGDIAVYNIDGAFYATDDRCTHGLSSLAEGELIGDEVECAMHFGSFHVPTGEPRLPPCSVALRTYRIELRDGGVYAILAA